jgi:hypothetical protein
MLRAIEVAMVEPVHLSIVGAGRIGSLFAALADAGGRPQALHRRGEGLLLLPPGPVLLAVRNDDLDAAIARIPEARRLDLCFVQNGILLPWLRARGLSACTRGQVWVAVTAVGADPVPGAPTVFGGPWAPLLVGLMTAGGIDARVAADEGDLRRDEAAKFAWICTMGTLAGATGLTVGQVCDQLPAEVAAMCAEIAVVLSAELEVGITADELTMRVLAYSAAIPHFRTSRKEPAWRDGWLAEAALRQGVLLPVHSAWGERRATAPT